MTPSFLNYTAFDIQLWPPPPKTDSQVFADLTLNPLLLLPLLFIYHSLTSVALQTQNFRDYPGRRDTFWFQFCLGHMFVLELFMIRILYVYEKSCPLSEIIHLLVFTIFSSLVNALT